MSTILVVGAIVAGAGALASAGLGINNALDVNIVKIIVQVIFLKIIKLFLY